MPDPTLTRYRGTLDSDGPFYLCEEADRLIQALREDVAQLQEGKETLQILLKNAYANNQAAYQERNAAQAEVGALRRALDAAQPERQSSGGIWPSDMAFVEGKNGIGKFVPLSTLKDHFKKP